MTRDYRVEFKATLPLHEQHADRFVFGDSSRQLQSDGSGSAASHRSHDQHAEHHHQEASAHHSDVQHALDAVAAVAADAPIDIHQFDQSELFHTLFSFTTWKTPHNMPEIFA